ncbi:MAG: ABC transporter permease subunit [Thermoanaerobaculia bacterium]|nr:ABC transporter permease subunit [Thermoanaerobaculia bacterium]
MDAGTSTHRFVALVKREFLEGSRGSAVFVGRTLLAAIPFLLTLQALEHQPLDPELAPETVSRFADRIFLSGSHVVCICLVIMGAGLAIRSMRAMIESGTLELLLLSRLSPLAILLGKLVAITALIGTMSFALVPFLLMAGLHGGIDHEWLAALAIFSVLFGASGVATGILTSVYCRSALGAWLAGAAIWIVMRVLLPPPRIDYQIISPSSLWETILPAGSITRVATQGVAGGAPLDGSLNMVLSALLCLCVAALRLPHLASRPFSAGKIQVFERIDAFFERLNWNWKGIRFPGGRVAQSEVDPVYWLATMTGGTGLARHNVRVATALSLPVIWDMGFCASRGIALDELFWPFHLFQALLGGTLGSLSIAPERARQAFSVLLATSLSNRAIIAGKTRAGLRAVVLIPLPFVLVALFLALLEQVIGRDPIHPMFDRPADSYLFLASGLALGVAAYLVSQFCSLAFGSSLKAWTVSSASVATLYFLAATASGYEQTPFLTVVLVLCCVVSMIAYELCVRHFSRFTGRAPDADT